MGNIRIFLRFFDCLFMLIAVLFSSVFAETEVKITARIIADEVPLNREVHLKVSATWNGPANSIKFFPLDPPTTTNLKLASTATANIVKSDSGIVSSTRQYEFLFTGETLGMAYIDEVILRYHDADLQEHVLRTARLPLKIIDPVRDSGGKSIEQISIALILTVGIAAASFFFFYKRKRAAREVENATPEKSYYEKALDDLHNKINLQTSDIGSQYAEISRIMWHFLRRRFDLQPAVGTTEELMKKLEFHHVPMEDRTALQEMMQACDLAKFSGGGTDPNQLVRIYEITKQLVEKLENKANLDSAD